jgi:hypothetical protein
MKTKVKEVLDELIQFRNDSIVIKYLSKVNELQERVFLRSFIAQILLWLSEDPFLDTEIYDSSKTKISKMKNNVSVFFQNCSELSQLLKIDGEYVYFADSLTEAEKEEIRAYVKENVKFQLIVNKTPPRTSRRRLL